MCLYFNRETSERTAKIRKEHKGEYFFATKRVEVLGETLISPVMKKTLNYPYHEDRRRGFDIDLHYSYSSRYDRGERGLVVELECCSFYGGGIHVYQPPAGFQQFYPSPDVMWEDIKVTSLSPPPKDISISSLVVVAVDDLIMIGNFGELVVAAIEFPPDLF